MKEKIINYIETLEAKAYQSDDYFKQRNDLYIENQNKDKEIERLNNILKEIEKHIDYYAIENDDFSKFYNNEEIEILKIIGSDKE